MENQNKAPTVFISYSWDSEEHKKWVSDLSKKLSLYGIKTILDENDLELGDELTEFMENSIEQSDFVLIICTPTYKQKADRRLGGVGYEESIITTDVLITRKNRKYITVLASGNWVSSVPIWAIGKKGADLSSELTYRKNFAKLVNTICGREVIIVEEETNKTWSYEYLLGYFQNSPESLQISLLENICNICSQVDIIDSYGVLEDLCLFLDKIESSVTLSEKVNPIYAKAKEEAERLLIEDMRDLWNGR